MAKKNKTVSKDKSTIKTIELLEPTGPTLPAGLTGPSTPTGIIGLTLPAERTVPTVVLGPTGPTGSLNLLRLEGAGDNGAYNTFFPPSTDLGNLYRSVGATGVDIGGTITYLGDATETIKKTVESFHFVDQKQMNQELRPILEQIKNIQADVLPKLELAKNTITNVEEFLKDNVTFLTNSIEVKGRLQLIESNLNSFSTRIDTLEKIRI